MEPQHPLHTCTWGLLAHLAGEPVVASGVDGCGVPTYAVTLAGLAVKGGTGPSGRWSLWSRSHCGSWVFRRRCSTSWSASR